MNSLKSQKDMTAEDEPRPICYWDEMVKQRHQLNGYEFEQTPGNSEGQGSLVCYCLWGSKELDMT